MIILRNEQKDSLKIPLIHKQVLGLVAHIKKHFPRATAEKTDDELYDRIKKTVKGAEKYGIKAERDVFKYINISMLYGVDFDERPETAWTVKYLTHEDISSPSLRINRLYDEVVYRMKVDEKNALLLNKYYSKNTTNPE